METIFDIFIMIMGVVTFSYSTSALSNVNYRFIDFYWYAVRCIIKSLAVGLN